MSQPYPPNPEHGGPAPEGGPRPSDGPRPATHGSPTPGPDAATSGTPAWAAPSADRSRADEPFAGAPAGPAPAAPAWSGDGWAAPAPPHQEQAPGDTASRSPGSAPGDGAPDPEPFGPGTGFAPPAGSGYAPPAGPGYAGAGATALGHPGPGMPAGAPYGPGYPGQVPAPPRKSKALMITLIVLAVVLVLCGGGIAVVWWTVSKVPANSTGAPAVRPSASATASASPSASPSAAPPVKITLQEPAKLGGRAMLKDTASKKFAKELREDMKDFPDAEHSIAGIYGSRGKRDIVVVAAVAVEVLDPEADLELFMAGDGDEIKLTETIDPGPLGGVARCGSGTESGQKMAICAWADHGSIGFITMFFKDAKALKPQFAKLRGEVEKAG